MGVKSKDIMQDLRYVQGLQDFININNDIYDIISKIHIYTSLSWQPRNNISHIQQKEGLAG